MNHYAVKNIAFLNKNIRIDSVLKPHTSALNGLWTFSATRKKRSKYRFFSFFSLFNVFQS